MRINNQFLKPITSTGPKTLPGALLGYIKNLSFIKAVLGVLVILFFGPSAKAACERQPISIQIQTQIPNPVYHHHLSGQNFPNKPKNSPPDQLNMEIRGLTVSKLAVSGSAASYATGNGREVCVGMKEITFKIGLEQLDVYIDKKYAPNSCPYKVVKEHENIHVSIFRQAVPFFKPDIEKELQKAVNKLRPVSLYASEASDKRIKEITSAQFNQVINDIKPLIDHINAKITEKNEKIDTTENYKAMSALCKKW